MRDFFLEEFSREETGEDAGGERAIDSEALAKLVCDKALPE